MSETDQQDADGRWVWYPTRKWVDNGSAHPRDVEGDPA